MARTRCAFTTEAVARALRGADAAGRAVRRVEIDREGKIVLVMVETAAVEPEPARPADIVL